MTKDIYNRRCWGDGRRQEQEGEAGSRTGVRSVGQCAQSDRDGPGSCR